MYKMGQLKKTSTKYRHYNIQQKKCLNSMKIESALLCFYRYNIQTKYGKIKMKKM